MTVLDTTVLVARSRNVPGAIAALQRNEEKGVPMRVPAAVWVEFLSVYGPAPRSAAVGALESMVRFEAFDRVLADEAIRLQHELLRSGRRLAWHDLQVAATALHYNEPLVSNDRGYDVVPGLHREPF